MGISRWVEGHDQECDLRSLILQSTGVLAPISLAGCYLCVEDSLVADAGTSRFKI